MDDVGSENVNLVGVANSSPS